MFTCMLRHYAFYTVLSIFSQILRRSLTARESVDFRGHMHRDKSVALQWGNQLRQSLEEGCRKARLGVRSSQSYNKAAKHP